MEVWSEMFEITTETKDTFFDELQKIKHDKKSIEQANQKEQIRKEFNDVLENLKKINYF
jgi:hypothetical protein